MFFPHHLKVFLCHSSTDKTIIRHLCQQIKIEGIDPWLDEERLASGQNWDLEISNAIYTSNVVLICLSQNFLQRESYTKKEVKWALEMPEYSSRLIVLKLEECQIPTQLRNLQTVNYFDKNGFSTLMSILTEKMRKANLAFDS
jgi:hypothetical protein